MSSLVSRPVVKHSNFVWFSAARSRPFKASLTPLEAHRLAKALPIPLPAPDMKATLLRRTSSV